MKTLFLSLIVFFGQCVLAQVNLNSSLTACYSLDGNANDPINNLNGVLSSVTSTVDRFNNPGSAYYFNGSSSSFITLPNNSLIKPNAISFSAWVKTNTLNSQYIVFANNGCGSYFEGYAFAIHNPGTGVRFHLVKSNNCGGSTQISLNSSVLVSTGVWYHVGFYAGPDSLKIYVNGALSASLAYATTLLYSPTANVYFGGTNGTNNLCFNGTLDNVRFYNRKLTNAEFNQLYTQDPSCSSIVFPASSFSVSPANICAGRTVTLTDLSSNTPTSWNWQTPGANVSTASISNPTISFPNPGTYTVSLTASNGAGAGNTVSQSITVLPNPTINVTTNTSPFCMGQSATLSATGGFNYLWTNGMQTSTIAVSPLQNITYSVVGYGLNGCIGLGSINITVNPTPSLSISGNTIICEGLPTSLLAGGTPITFTWSNGFTGNLVSVTPTISTVYTVTGTDISGCTGSTSQLVFVNTAPSVMINASSNSICQGDAVVLNAGGAVSYVWSGGVVNNVPFFPSTTSSYSVVGTGTNSCKNTATVQIVVNPLPVLTHSVITALPVCAGEPVTLTAGGANIYNWSSGGVLPTTVVTPTATSNYTVTGTDANGCKDSYVFMVNVEPCLGLKENSYNVLSIYPNPNSGKFSMKGIGGEYKFFKILNLLGENIITKDLHSQNGEVYVDITDQPKGVYFIVLSNETLHQTYKFIKE